MARRHRMFIVPLCHMHVSFDVEKSLSEWTCNILCNVHYVISFRKHFQNLPFCLSFHRLRVFHASFVDSSNFSNRSKSRRDLSCPVPKAINHWHAKFDIDAKSFFMTSDGKWNPNNTLGTCFDHWQVKPSRHWHEIYTV